MNKLIKLVVFWLDKQRFALHLSAVERIVRIVEITPLPKAPEYIMGIINFQGKFIPVVNIRKLFLLPERDIDLNDQLIIANTSMRTVAIWVDSVSDVIERAEEEIIKAEKIFLDIDYVEGVFKLEDGIVLINDLDKFLTLEEITLLKAALKKQREKGENKKFIKKTKSEKEPGKKRSQKNIIEPIKSKVLVKKSK